jgi:hypothetical protein
VRFTVRNESYHLPTCAAWTWSCTMYTTKRFIQRYPRTPTTLRFAFFLKSWPIRHSRPTGLRVRCMTDDRFSAYGKLSPQALKLICFCAHMVTAGW